MDAKLRFLACLAAWSLAASAIAAEKPTSPAAPAVVYLGRSSEFAFPKRNMPNCGILLRELGRQALLVAARDELGLATRDVWLGDEMPAHGDNQPFEVATTQKKPRTLVVRRGSAPPGTLLLEVQPKARSLPKQGRFDVSFMDDYAAFAAEMEKLSRTKFVEALRQSGFAGPPNPIHDEAAVPAEVEQDLAQMTFTSQFAAVRRLHELMHTSGESPARIGSLVRGYANLGMLTQFQRHPAHKVFKARALLYAQRLLARDEKSAWARCHRAYALAAAGCHWLAIQAPAEGDRQTVLAACGPAEVLGHGPGWRPHDDGGDRPGIGPRHARVLSSARWALRGGGRQRGSPGHDGLDCDRRRDALPAAGRVSRPAAGGSQDCP